MEKFKGVFMGKLIRIASVFFALFLFNGNVLATNYFSWDIDNDPVSSTSPNLQLGQLFGQGGGATVYSTEEAHVGTTSMKFSVVGNDSGNQQLGVDWIGQDVYPFKMIGSPKLYYRWWMLIKPGFSWGDGTEKAKSSRTIGGSSDPRGYTGYIRKTGFQLTECEPTSFAGGACPNNGVFISYDLASQADGIWHEYVIAVKFNSSTSSSDAEFDAWVDGKFVGSVRDFKLHDIDGAVFTEGWLCWMATPFFQLNGTSSDGGIMYVDDFSVDDSFNSTAIFAPKPPGDLTVTK